ncbi:FtsX-like permease family protein [Colwellia piezophila]|uniref:FtsX-like permease family protein n=1 Tax=Colwellia piezophila TaxID=211668 RepID=UPI000361D6BF|nr:FtsX-like permease family protein [Colwellia piezophila]
MSVLIDIKYALRLLFKAPKFTAMTLSVLVGGLTISLFTFSFLYSTLHKALPMPEGETALVLSTETIGISMNMDTNQNSLSAYEFRQIAKTQSSLDEFGLYESIDARLSFEDTGKNISATYVDSGFFRFSRTKAMMGRTIQQQDMVVGTTPVAVISYETWQNELSGSKDVLTMTINLNDRVTDVIGVMPPGYRFPGIAKIWLPLKQSQLNKQQNTSSYFTAYARLKSGVSNEQATKYLSAALDQLYQQSVKLYNQPEANKIVHLRSYPMDQVNGIGNTMFIFLNVVAWSILALGCINVGNLLLARSMERQKETAIRAALGATSKRLVSQLMWEGIIITTVGAILSVLLVGAALDYTNIALHSWMPNSMVFWWHWGLDKETLGMAIIVTLVTIILAVFLPAWRSAHQDINAALRDGTRGAQGKKAGRLSRLLVTVQVFLVAFLMLIGTLSGFITQTFINLETGDDYSDIMRASINLPKNKYQTPQEQALLFQALLERIKNDSNVIDAHATTLSHLPIILSEFDFDDSHEKLSIDTFTVIGNTEFSGITLVAGRHLNRRDKSGARKVVLISQSMANRYWPGESALEKKITLEIAGKAESLFIVGIVTNRFNGRSLFGKLDSEDETYISGLQFIKPRMRIYYKTIKGSVNAAGIFYRALFEIDRNIDVVQTVQPAERNRNLMRDGMRLTSKVIFGTGFFALMLAMVGIYGLTANSVAQRTHEIGIRRAVGATDKNITDMFIKQGGRQLLTGLGLALLLFTLISVMFNEFSEGLIPTYLYFVLASVVIVSLSLIVMLAIYAPTRKAVVMEPSLALRYE